MPSLKRKRDGHEPNGLSGSDNGVPAGAKRSKQGRLQGADVVKHALLAQYYPRLLTLREYLLLQLPASSRIRRKKITAVGLAGQRSSSSGRGRDPPTDAELALGRLLDTTVVGCSSSSSSNNNNSSDQNGDQGSNQGGAPKPDSRWEQWINFSQKGDESYVTLSNGLRGAIFSQAEIVDFVIWLLFSREKSGSWPKHLLCDGFRRNVNPRGRGPVLTKGVPGLFEVFRNQRVQVIKEDPWPQLLMLLGKAGERIMIDLLVDCAIFLGIEAGKGNFYQLSGAPISELPPLAAKTTTIADPQKPGLPPAAGPADSGLSPAEITFVRSRMLYARAALNARGLVHFGLRHIHALNRFPCTSSPPPSGGAGAAEEEDHGPAGADPDFVSAPHSHWKPDENTVRIMMYIFPRQFGLHNVFTSSVDRQKTAQKFQDYTLREEEITRKYTIKTDGDVTCFKAHIPKRLRGKVGILVRKLQVLHGRCSYLKMLQHYCPVEQQVEELRNSRPSASHKVPSSTASKAQAKTLKTRRKARQNLPVAPTLQYSSLVDLATPISSVSAFCQAVLTKIVPNEFWGAGSAQEHNRKNFLKKVDHFVRMRRFEMMSLHEVLQGMKIADVEWLAPPALQKPNQKCSQTDTRKRAEIFYEFLYYLFDSILIPLIRGNFYVTESNVHRYRLFFFRHDVWRYIAEPAMSSLKAKMFEEVKVADALRILDARHLGFSQIRLLPKETTMRPIMNLRRRVPARGNTKLLGPSINTILGPVNSMLQFERSVNPGRLGSAMLCVGDIYQRLKAFKSRVGEAPFFFAKVDVKSAFDTIPQDAVMRLMRQVPGQSRYKIVKHVQVRPEDSGGGSSNTGPKKVSRKWSSMARAPDDSTSFRDLVKEKLAAKRVDTIFMDSVVEKSYDTASLMALMETHVRQNLVRISKKFYRQKDGIPQGSVLSSALCSYFYADLERQCLPFLQSNDCLLLRLIDDFLLVTLDRNKAVKFVRTMHAGIPEYGVTISAGKSLVNFEMGVGDGVPIPMVPAGQGFPYCGILIDCTTLDMSKDRGNVNDPAIFNSLVVEYSRKPGQNFKRKVLNAFKIQSQLMFFDTSHNSRPTVVANVYTAFVGTATKTWAYARCLPPQSSPQHGAGLLIETIKSLADVAYLLLSSKLRKRRYPGFECTVTKIQVAWLAMLAFRQVLRRKQTAHREVVAWLEREVRRLSERKQLDYKAMVGGLKGLSVDL